ncbi:MAG TPA: dockerin type I domain-containing protein [Pirellulales bacterium]|nr:dockerin type I domain-containing protein [Pirellulales bacterium]
MTRSLWFTTWILTAVALVAWVRPILAATGTTAFTGDGSWNSLYGQGFSLGTDATGFGVFGATGNTVNLTQFQFFKSGNADATGVQLAIVNWDTNFSSTSPTVVGLSTNTLDVTSANYAVGAPISFTFNNLALTYGRGTYDQNGFGVFESPDYAAIFVNNNGGTLTPVLTPVIIVNYNQVSMPYDGYSGDMNGWPTEYVPAHDYGYRRNYLDTNSVQHYGDYFKAATNYISGGYFSTFGPYFGDANFTATFTYTPKPGDFNGDGHVDAGDIVAMEQALANPSGFESTNGLSPSDYLALGDLNGDGKVTNADLQDLLAALQNGHGSLIGVPEPSALVLLTLGGIALLGHGRRSRKHRSRI